jgi:hypothetical protein
MVDEVKGLGGTESGVVVLGEEKLKARVSHASQCSIIRQNVGRIAGCRFSPTTMSSTPFPVKRRWNSQLQQENV